MKKYAIEMNRHQTVLYLASEFGTRGAVRILNGLKPFGNSNEAYTGLTNAGVWYRFSTGLFQGQRQTKRVATDLMRRISEYVAYQEGRLGQDLCGSAGIMRVVEI